jgi:hypothetical protein
MTFHPDPLPIDSKPIHSACDAGKALRQSPRLAPQNIKQVSLPPCASMMINGSDFSRVSEHGVIGLTSEICNVDEHPLPFV